MISPDPGSLRDPASRVVHDDDRVVRLFDTRGMEGWRALSGSALFARATNDGRLIHSSETQPLEGWVGAVEHPRLPFVSYPYEWTFNMLKDAALLQLDLLGEALAEGLTIKDATPFNIQFLRGSPVFIDIGSFETYRPGEPWIGYRQFTRQFLFPLMMRAWADLPFQPWLRGDMRGPTSRQMSKLLPASKRWRPASLMHVSLQARMEDRLSGRSVRGDLSRAGFNADLILTNVKRLRGLVESLEWSDSGSNWSDYGEYDHVGRDREVKAEFLKTFLHRIRPERVLDLGANDGYFSLIAADGGAHAIAVDGDEPVLDGLYRFATTRDISVVVSDLTDPTPSQGWAGEERRSLSDRARPDVIIAYGLIHHLIYTASIPPRAVIEWLRGFGCPVVLEFVAPEDEMVRRLTVNKLETELHPGRDESSFRRELSSSFRVESEVHLESGSRILLELHPR